MAPGQDEIQTLQMKSQLGRIGESRHMFQPDLDGGGYDLGRAVGRSIQPMLIGFVAE